MFGKLREKIKHKHTKVKMLKIRQVCHHIRLYTHIYIYYLSFSQTFVGSRRFQSICMCILLFLKKKQTSLSQCRLCCTSCTDLMFFFLLFSSSVFFLHSQLRKLEYALIMVCRLIYYFLLSNWICLMTTYD